MTPELRLDRQQQDRWSWGQRTAKACPRASDAGGERRESGEARQLGHTREFILYPRISEKPGKDQKLSTNSIIIISKQKYFSEGRSEGLQLRWETSEETLVS